MRYYLKPHLKLIQSCQREISMVGAREAQVVSLALRDITCCIDMMFLIVAACPMVEVLTP